MNKFTFHFYSQLFDLFRACKWKDFNILLLGFEINDIYWQFDLGFLGLNIFISYWPAGAPELPNHDHTDA